MRHLLALTLGAGLLASTALATPASALTWDFGEHGTGTLPTAQQFDVGGDFFLTARGFAAPNVGAALYSKNDGPGEVGLGFNGLVDHEISGNNFIQLNMDGLRSRLTNFSFSMDSVDNNEGWVVYGSQDAAPFTFFQLAHSIGLLDNGVHTLADGYDNYNFFFAPSGLGGPTGNSDVVLHSFSATLAVPGPIAGAGLPALFAMGGLAFWRRRRARAA